MLLKAISETASLTQLRVKGPMLSSGRQEYEQRTRICLLVPVTLYSMQGFEKNIFWTTVTRSKETTLANKDTSANTQEDFKGHATQCSN